MDRKLADLDVAVLAGGLGTRLAGAVPGLPKILAPVAGRPFVEHLLDWLAREGARRIVFLLGHRADAVQAHLAAHPRPGLTFDCAIEPSPLGTGGALAHARPLLRSDPVLVVNGDTFVDADLAPLLAARAEAAMLCVRVPDAGRYGRIDIQDGFVARLAARLLDGIPRHGAVSLERDVFEKLPPGSIAAHLDAQARFVDIGTPESWRGAGAVVTGATP
jgi:mannose-1-phosphate guanylyltransferase